MINPARNLSYCGAEVMGVWEFEAARICKCMRLRVQV
jgi:hypothetical protein